MARRTNFLEKLAVFGGAAAATALVYWKREEIRGFLEKTAEQLFSENAASEMPSEEEIPEEKDIVIDATALTGREETAETAEEENPAE